MEERERLFVSDIRQDLDCLREVGGHFPEKKTLWKAWSASIAMLILVTVELVFEAGILNWVCVGFLIGFCIDRFRNKDGAAYAKLLEENGGVPRRNLVYIREKGILYRNPESGNEVEIAYSQITAISRTKSFLVLTCDGVPGYLINHTNLTGGTATELESWLLERAGVQKIENRFDLRILRKVVMAVAAAALVFTLFTQADFFRPRLKVMSAPEAAAVLEELGISLPDDVPMEELESYGADEYMLENLLCYAGMGEYDDDFNWTPAESCVYAFDLEVFDVGHMYTDFLRGVEAMTGGDLAFSEVIEDDSEVDFETGRGHKTITVTCSGRTQTFRPKMYYDWFDVQFANDLARWLGEDENGNRLRFHFDGYQMMYVFYCDDAWAERFENLTGYVLSTRIQ